VLRGLDATRHIPVIAVTTKAMDSDIEAAGFDDYLTKPIYIKQLCTAIDRRISAANSKNPDQRQDDYYIDRQV